MFCAGIFHAYHVVVAHVLVGVVTTGLQLAGVPLAAMGTWCNGRLVLTSCSSRHAAAPVKTARYIARCRQPKRHLTRVQAIDALQLFSSRYILVGDSLRTACNIAATQQVDFLAFSTEDIVAAAEAALDQIVGLRILHRSACTPLGRDRRDQAFPCGELFSDTQMRISTYLGARFNEKASDLVDDRKVDLDLNPVELALGCYPVLQLALHIFYANHSPHLCNRDYDTNEYYDYLPVPSSALESEIDPMPVPFSLLESMIDHMPGTAATISEPVQPSPLQPPDPPVSLPVPSPSLASNINPKPIHSTIISELVQPSPLQPPDPPESFPARFPKPAVVAEQPRAQPSRDRRRAPRAKKVVPLPAPDRPRARHSRALPLPSSSL